MTKRDWNEQSIASTPLPFSPNNPTVSSHNQVQPSPADTITTITDSKFLELEHARRLMMNQFCCRDESQTMASSQFAMVPATCRVI